MTKLLYLDHPEWMTYETTLSNTGKDDRGLYLVPKETIFYPQGGGQPSDQGYIEIGEVHINIHFVRQVDSEVRHYVDFYQLNWINQSVTLHVEEKRRQLNTRYHTAGHLIGCVVESLFPNCKAIKGHQFPREAYVEFEGIINPSEEILETLQRKVSFDTSRNLKVNRLEASDMVRAIEIERYPPVPCGGTHVSELQEIGIVTITKIKPKGGNTKISYGII